MEQREQARSPNRGPLLKSDAAFLVMIFTLIVPLLLMLSIQKYEGCLEKGGKYCPCGARLHQSCEPLAVH